MMRAAAALSLAATPAFADFGAIAYSAETGGYGVGWRAQDAQGAAATAATACKAYGAACGVTVRFRDACGALAVGRSPNIHATAAAPRLAEAETRALDACARLNDAGCEIEVSFCSNR